MRGATTALLSRGPTPGLTSEADLLDASRIPRLAIRRVPCACGGWLSAAQGDDGALVAAVMSHNGSTAHRSWRARQEAV